jgi:hypothetical protein
MPDAQEGHCKVRIAIGLPGATLSIGSLYIGRQPMLLRMCDAARGCHGPVVTSVTTKREGLRSAAMTNYVIPRLRTKFSERSFSYTLVQLPETHCLPICADKLPPSPSKATQNTFSLHSVSINLFYDSCNATMFFYVMRAISNIFITITITPTGKFCNNGPYRAICHR